MPTNTSPLLFVAQNEVESFSLKQPYLNYNQPPNDHKLIDDDEQERMCYAQAFHTIQRQLNSKALQKVVLSRRLHLSGLAHTDAERLFFRACHYRPNNFVAYWSTPLTGQWLIATPEPLLEVRQRQGSTVALAGTLPWADENPPRWNNKNCEEQAIVARYIKTQLAVCGIKAHASDTYSFRSGNIQHLRTDFSFPIENESQIKDVVQHLHPTPAVCGLPCATALKTILEAELTSRNYYAGFSGPLQLNGETHLYVTLRCMQFSTHAATLYAGGGIMPESKEVDEWEETGRKLETMKLILKPYL